jgi:hypothetical protein
MDTHGEPDMSTSTVLHDTAVRIDTSVALSAALKVLGMLLTAMLAVILFFGPTWLDARIGAAVEPFSGRVQNMVGQVGSIQGQVANIEKKIDASTVKDKADDDDAAKTRERVALLEQMALRGREERIQQYKDVVARLDIQDERSRKSEAQLAAIIAILERLEQRK